jgi:hypothetical protein
MASASLIAITTRLPNRASIRRGFHGYLAKLARYLAKPGSAGEFLRKHHGQRVFYVAPWLSQLSGVTLAITRIRRHVWDARQAYCDMPKVPERLVERVERLVGPPTAAPAAP